MKESTLESLGNFEKRIRQFKRSLQKERGDRIAKKGLRDEAEAIADAWVEEIRSILEHRFKLDSSVISFYAEQFKRLHKLSRPNNLRKSYLCCIEEILQGFKDDLILPVQQSPGPVSASLDLSQLVGAAINTDESDYLNEANECAKMRCYRAAIVLGWCAAIDRIQRKIQSEGFDGFSSAAARMSQATGRFKRFNKQYDISTMSELQEVFDSDVIWVLEGMNLIDANQGDRLRNCFQYRCQAAHPGYAPVAEAHLRVFFHDLREIVLANPTFAVAP